MDENLYKEHYDVQSKHWWFKAKKSIVLSFINRYCPNLKKNRILDAGCGSGLMLAALKQFGEVSGMDYSTEAIQFSKKHFSGDLRKGELPTNVPFQANTFDLVIALDIIEHIVDDIASIKSLQNLLTPDGYCIFTVPAFMFLWTDHDDVNQHKRRYRAGELKQKLEVSGFKIIRMSYYNTLLFPLIFIIRIIYGLLNIKTGADIKMPGNFLNSLFLRIFSFEKYLLKYFSFPFGVSIIVVAKKQNR